MTVKVSPLSRTVGGVINAWLIISPVVIALNSPASLAVPVQVAPLNTTDIVAVTSPVGEPPTTVASFSLAHNELFNAVSEAVGAVAESPISM